MDVDFNAIDTDGSICRHEEAEDAQLVVSLNLTFIGRAPRKSIKHLSNLSTILMKLLSSALSPYLWKGRGT